MMTKFSSAGRWWGLADIGSAIGAAVVEHPRRGVTIGRCGED
ncbi:hypothetical protein ACLB1O_09360 [Escherichia coli]